MAWFRSGWFVVGFAVASTYTTRTVTSSAHKLVSVTPKKNKYSVDVVADDKLTEKKDRNINEPLQFYVSNSLYELVVNTVGKDQITGYLSTPKYQARNK